jgi:2,4-dienoyl-CoA reductase-like NADH-dependent reductase (Old Yellow Enzyme family)
MSLFEPVSFRGGKVAKNRISLAPLTNQQSHADGALSDDELRWLAMRADGGFGIVETCAAHVALDGQGWPGELGVFEDRLVPRLSELSARLRGPGALSLVQLFHGGARSPSKLVGQRPWSASAFAVEDDKSGFESPREATEADVARVIEDFRRAARRCLDAGFDGIELHGAHGYLLCQFLSRTMNTRADAWGGSLEGRARLLRETVRAVRAACPHPFLVGVRLSPEDFAAVKGLDLDESLQVARWLRDDGVDFVHLSLWNVEKNTTKRPDAHAIPLFRESVGPDVRILAAGNVWTRAEAEAVIARGADVVALGKAGIANPDWPARVEADPQWQPRHPPLTTSELCERGLSEAFAGYMKRWKGFVAE